MNRQHTAFSLVLGIMLTAACLMLAQTYERVAPVKMPENPPAEPVLIPETRDKEASQEQLLESLKGIVLFAERSQFQKAGRPEVSGVLVDGVSIVDEVVLREQLKPFLGEPVSLASLQKVSLVVVAHCRSLGRPVVDCILPSGQDITSGVVQFWVLEGRLGEVEVRGNEYFESDLIREAIRMEPGDVFRDEPLTEDLNWANQNPFRRVNLALRRGEDFGEVDLVLDVQDRFPLRVYSTVNNSGTDSTGDWRASAGFNWGNAFGWDHLLNYQFSGSKELEVMRAHSLSYRIPLPWRDTLTVFGSHSRSHPDTLRLLTLEGEVWQAGMRYTGTLPLWEQMRQSWQVGFDYKQSNNNLELGGTSIFGTRVDVTQFVAQWDAQRPDSHGATMASLQFFVSPGDITSHNTEQDYLAQKAFSDPSYAYVGATLTRSTTLAKPLDWVVTLDGQWSNEVLPATEQYSIGGLSTVRGYEESEASGDSGVRLSSEWRLNIDDTAKKILPSDATATVYAYWDYASATAAETLPAQNRETSLMSVGPGLEVSIGQGVSAYAVYGWQLREKTLDDRQDAKAHIGLTISY